MTRKNRKVLEKDIHIYIQMHTYTYICICEYPYLCVRYTHMLICTFAYIYTHVQVEESKKGESGEV